MPTVHVVFVDQKALDLAPRGSGWRHRAEDCPLPIMSLVICVLITRYLCTETSSDFIYSGE